MTDEVSPMEERLKGILFRFMELQDRLNTERLAVATQSAKLDELIKLFRAEVQDFKSLAPNVQRQLLVTMEKSAQVAAQQVGDVVAKALTSQVDKSSDQLQASVHFATDKLRAFEAGVKSNFYYYIIGLVGIVVLVGFLVGRFAVPTPYVPLTDEDLKTYRHGRVFDAFWPKLSDSEQKRLLDIVNNQKNAEGEYESFLQAESE